MDKITIDGNKNCFVIALFVKIPIGTVGKRKNLCTKSAYFTQKYDKNSLEYNGTAYLL
jgi:hypothetical protein